MKSEAAAPVPAKDDTGPFTLRQRLQLWLITWTGWLGIRLIGPTLRFTVSIEEGGPPESALRPCIYVFWHQCVFMATWWYRHRDIAVMTSRSFDGEYIARIIEKFGYRAVRGSSSRGAVRALLGLHTEIEAGRSTAFTIDGPRGPKWVAKPGPVLLGRNTGAPILTFHLAAERAWRLKTWDEFIIPKPFSRVLLRVGRLIRVPEDTGSAQAQSYHAEMQATLDRIREYAEEHVRRLH